VGSHDLQECRNLKTRYILSGSSVCLAIGGLSCLFVPAETLTALGLAAGSPVVAQLLGAIYLGAAAANWNARGVAIGGIYARPLSVANFMHFVVGSTVLAKGLDTGVLNIVYLLVTVTYLVLAVLFALLLFGRIGALSGRDSASPRAE
jgi:hypothetical protein